MSVKSRNIHPDYSLAGVFASATLFLADARNGGDAQEGDMYYDTALNQLRTYDGSSWSAAGQSGTGAGTLDAVANAGQKITIDAAFSNGIEIEATDAIIAANGQLLLLDNNDTGSDIHCLECTNAGTAPSIIITGQASSDDIQGTSDAWAITSAGVATLTGVTMVDDQVITLGTGSDATIQWDQTALAFDGAAADTAIHIGKTNNQDLVVYGATTTNAITVDTDDSALLCAFNGFDIQLQDDDILNFGDSNDVSVTWDQTNLKIEAVADNTGQIRIGSTNSMDFAVYGSTATNIALFDVSAAVIELNGWDVNLQDDDILQFGDAADVAITWDQTKLNVTALVADTRMLLGTASAGFDLEYYFETAGTIICDYDGDVMTFDACDLALGDDDYILLGDAASAGSSNDGTIRWDASNDNIEIVGDVDITGTLTVSGAFDIGNFSFGDDEELRFGNSNDFVMHYDSSAANLLLDAAAANDVFDIGSSVDTDVIFHGGTATYDVHWDSSEDTLAFLDNAVLGFGNTAASPDIEISWDTTRLNITGSGNQIRFGADDEGIDVLFYGETASAQMLWDESADQLVVAGGAQISLNDDVELLLGTGTANAGDFSIYSDGTDLFISEIAAGDKNLKIGADGDGINLYLYGTDSGRDLYWVQASNMLEFQDNAVLALGTGSDITMKFDATDLLIDGAAADTKIKVGATNNQDLIIYGATTTDAITYDTSALDVQFNGFDLTLQDDDILNFGDSDDITLTWDQTTWKIDGAAADTPLHLGDTTTGFDITYYFEAAGTIDIDYDGDNMTFSDDMALHFGTSDDVTIKWDQTNLKIDGAAADTPLHLGDTTTGFDITYYFEDAGTIAVDYDGDSMTFSDDMYLNFGSAGTSDSYMYWDQTNLRIVPSSAVRIGDATNYLSIDATGDVATGGTVTITCGLGDTTNFNGLIIPGHASSSPSGAPAGAGIYFEQDASKLWVYNVAATAWVGQVLS